MNKQQLLQKLSNIEWEDFEVKAAKSGLPKSIWETVSAFSNTSGGWIVFGVAQEGKKFNIEGLKNPEKIEHDLLTTLNSSKFNQHIRPDSKKYILDNKTILAFFIPISKAKPVYFNSPVNTFIRSGSGDSRASSSEIDAMYRDQAFGTQTTEIVPDSSPSDLAKLSLERYREYMARFNPTLRYNEMKQDEFLVKTQIVVDGNLTFAGLLFLGNRDAIFRHFPDFRIDLIEVPATSYSDAKPRYTYRLGEQENIWEYYFTLFERITQKVDQPFQMTKEGFAIGDYPYVEALREGLVNLLMHNDYFSPAKPRIRIFTDRIEYFNPGGFPKPLEELLKADYSIPRNPILAKLFRFVKLSENIGFGFDKMIKGWQTYRNSVPEFTSGIDHVIVTFSLLEGSVKKGVQKRECEKGSVKNGIQKRKDIKGSIRLTEKQKELIKLIKDEPDISYSKAAERLSVRQSSAQKRFETLVKKGVIKHEGPSKGGHWKLLTDI